MPVAAAWGAGQRGKCISTAAPDSGGGGEVDIMPITAPRQRPARRHRRTARDSRSIRITYRPGAGGVGGEGRGRGAADPGDPAARSRPVRERASQ